MTEAPTRVADVVVNGRRYSLTYTNPPWIQPIPPANDTAIRDPIDIVEPDYPCDAMQGKSEQEKLQRLLQFAVAIWRSKALAQTPSNREWGAAFYVDSNGEIKHTPFIPGPGQTAGIDWASLPKLANGSPDYGSVIAIAHTHPRYNKHGDVDNYDYYEVSDPARLLRPSPDHTDGSGIFRVGDWANYDSVRDLATWQQANAGGSGPRSDLSMIIVGFDGSRMAINQYGASDRNAGGVPYTSPVATGTGVGSDGLPGARGTRSLNPLPPCSSTT